MLSLEEMVVANNSPRSSARAAILQLLCDYVCNCIGELDGAGQEGARRTVQRVFGGGRDWRETLRHSMGLTPEIDAEMRTFWRQVQEQARARGEVPSPQTFARDLVRTNFASMLEQQIGAHR